jgi:hypothetical protein
MFDRWNQHFLFEKEVAMITRYNCLLTLASFANAQSFRRTYSTAKRLERQLWSKLVLHALTGSLLVLGAALPSLAAIDTVTSLAEPASLSMNAPHGIAILAK